MSSEAWELCEELKLKYDCWKMWTTFSQFGSVDGIPNRAAATFNQPVNPCPWATGDPKTDGYLLLNFFMYKIVAAANHVTAKDDASASDMLQEAIGLLEPILGYFSRILQPSDLNDIQLCLKRHAVLEPLRNNDRIRAKVTNFSMNKSIAAVNTAMLGRKFAKVVVNAA